MKAQRRKVGNRRLRARARRLTPAQRAARRANARASARAILDGIPT